MRGLAHRRERIKEGFKGAGAAQPPEPLPDAVPLPEALRKRPAGDVVNRKIVQRSRNRRSSRPLSPRRERDARNTCKTTVQSSSVIPVSMVGSPKPTTHESQKN